MGASGVTNVDTVGDVLATIQVFAAGTPSASCPTPTPEPAPACVGDCNDDGAVTVDEIITFVNIDLGVAQLSACPNAACCGITCIIQIVNYALLGCPQPGSASPSMLVPRCIV